MCTMWVLGAFRSESWKWELHVDGCEPPCEYWELDPGSLQEHMPLTTVPSLLFL